MSTRKRCLVCSSKNPSEIPCSVIQNSVVEGELNFFFSVDMREFLSNSEDHEKDITKAAFEKLQGSRKFAKALREMETDLELHQDAKSLLIKGFNNGVFGGILTRWLDFPTFRVAEGDEEWFIRCSWLGVFEIHLRKVVNKRDGYNFVTIISEILKYRTRFDEGNEENGKIDEKNIWHKVFSKINAFCESVTQFNYENIRFKKTELNNHISFTQRQRYCVVMAKNIYCSQCRRRLPAEVLSQNTLLTSLLYSSLVSDINEDGKSYEQFEDIKIPEMTVDLVKNLSTWNDEICSFGAERGFIYYNPNFIIEEYEDKYPYDDYWKYILRGIQHTVTTRAALQSLQTQIKKLTDKLPGLISAIDKNDYPTDAQKKNLPPKNQVSTANDEDLANSLANILQMMPQINTICIPTVTYKSNFAIEKFKYLNEECFDFPSILTSLRRDIRDVSTFLEFYKSYQLQIEVEKRRTEDRTRNKIAYDQLKRDKEQDTKRDDFHVLIAIAAVLVVAPTAINDGAIILSKFFYQKEEANPIFLPISIFVYVGIIVFLWLYRKKQEEDRRKKPIFAIDNPLTGRIEENSPEKEEG